MEILVIHPGALGDIILSLPALALLRRTHPEARMTLAGNLDYVTPVARDYADRLISISTLPVHRLYVSNRIPLPEMNFWNCFDRILSWTGFGDSAFTRNLTENHRDARVASWRPRPGEKKHVSQLFADTLRPWIRSDLELMPPKIVPDTKARREARQWLSERGWNGSGRLIGFHPGAGSLEKRWPAEDFGKLALRLLQHGRKLLVIEGPAEPGLGEEMLRALPVSETILVESVELDLLAGILECCGAYVGNDSGVAHLAAALQLRCVILYGPTLPDHWAPLGEGVTTLRNADLCETCGSRLVSNPNLRFEIQDSDGGVTHRQTKHTCLSNISVEEVFQLLIRDS